MTRQGNFPRITTMATAPTAAARLATAAPLGLAALLALTLGGCAGGAEAPGHGKTPGGRLAQLTETRKCAGCDLSGLSLRRLDLTGADLSGANLAGADLRRADLRDANLAGASLTGARLRDARLRRASFSGSDLRKADLREADLREADLRGADFGQADLTHARLDGARFGRTNLSDARGIDADLKARQVWREEAAADPARTAERPGLFVRWWRYLFGG